MHGLIIHTIRTEAIAVVVEQGVAVVVYGHYRNLVKT